MSFRNMLPLLAIVSLCAGPAFAEGLTVKEAADLFAKGETLLKQGDLDGAYQAYVSAARANPENAAYAEKAKLVRRVQLLRKYVEENEVSPKWEKMVLSLHAFFLQNGVHGEALAVDRMAHGKMNSALSASLLAETLLEMDRNAEALEVLKSLEPGKLDLQNHLYLGISLARLGKADEARDVAAHIALPETANLGQYYDLARLNTLLGDHAEACVLLTRCFEMTPPSQLDTVKGFAKQCADFKPLLALADFQTAMKTASKIEESSCSSGASCATCPNRSGCSTGAGTGTEKEDCSDCKEGKGGGK